MLRYIKRTLSRLVYGARSDSNSFIQYLRKHGCNIGEGCKFYSPRTTIVDVGRADWISIGKNTKITSGVIILAHDYSPSVLVHTHNEILLSGGKPTIIGNNCFIGMNAIIMPGRRVGNNCIIGTGSIVTTDIPDNVVVAGNPAKIIMTVDEFYAKRKRNYLNDAKRNVRHFYETHHRFPFPNELAGFALLFMERSKSNFEKYFSTYMKQDNDAEDLKRCFYETKPMFDSYEAFIDFCMCDSENSAR